MYLCAYGQFIKFLTLNKYMKNESNVDRVVRAIIGIVLIVIGHSFSGYLSTVLYVVGIIALITAITGFCLLYKLFDFSTKK